MILDLKITAIAIGVSFLLGTTSSWWVTAEYKEAKYSQAISQIKLDAAAELEKARIKAVETERENNRLATELEVAHNEFRQNLDNVKADNQRLADELGGLHDRYSTCGSDPKPSSGGTPVNPALSPTGAKLSKEASQFLLSESRRADEAAAYAATCYKWIQKLKGK